MRHTTFPPPLLPNLLLPTVFACLLVLPLAAPAALAEEMPDVEAANRDLELLDDLLDDNDARVREIETYLDLAVRNATAMKPPVAAEGDELTKEQEDLADDIEEFREDVVDVLLDALDETNLNPAGYNDLMDVNVMAGRLLARTPALVTGERARKKLSKKILRKVKRFEKVRYEVEPRVFGAAFDALAALGDERTMRWVVDNYLHTRKRAEDVGRMKEAMQALRRWDPMPGDVRHELVDEMLKLYVAVEDLANTSQNDVSILATKRFWDQVRLDVIPLIQRAAGYPAGPQGAVLATMADYKAWFEDHESPRDPVWKRPAPEPRES